MRPIVMRDVGIFLLVLAAGAAHAEDVKGEWATDADRALAVARRSGRPVLAVAMDHG